VNGLVLVGIGEGIVIGIGYWVTGVPHPTLFGGLTAVAAMVPFGAPLVFGIAALILLSQGALVGAVALLALGMLVAFVADHFVRPVIIGGATRLPFLWVLLGILGGVESFGIIGLFIGPVVMSVVMQLWRDWVDDPGSRI
jgi:predicted PurR-regulated permease PerM